MDRAAVGHWIAEYERAWRSPGIEALGRLFTADAVYSPGPYAETVNGLDAIAAMWEAERDGPDEQFTMTSALVALDEHVAVARVEVHYADGTEWQDLWVMEFTPDTVCHAFEEWPIGPGHEAGS